MAVTLDGGCRVSELREGAPMSSGTATVFPRIGRAVGARAISLRVLEFAPGVSPGMRSPGCDEVCYALSGRATVYLDGLPYEINAETGFYVPRDAWLTVDNPGPQSFMLASARCPEPADELGFGPPCRVPAAGARRPDRDPVVRLRDRVPQSTGDRWYRVLVDDAAGSTEVTQFVGGIPPGRAPDHYHQYEEVLIVLAGGGRMWAGSSSAPIATGSCIYLPRGQLHCVENLGPGELRLLGVFYPAGSPAVRYEAS